MKSKKLNYIVYLSALITSASHAFTAPEVTGKITYENAQYTNSRDALTKNQALGSASARGKDSFKSELSARIYLDGEVGDSSAYHLELQGYNNGDAVSDADSNENYTQRDALREAYIDTTAGDWAVRLGKQQTVWGTADGYKLLDTINPTDYSEMAQNQIEDSRITTWQLNAETNTDNGGNVQVVLSQPRENIFAGFDRNINTSVNFNNTGSNAMDATDLTTSNGHWQGNPFVLKGVDSMAGKSNGFLNIVPDLGSIAKRFYNEFSATGAATLQNSTTTTVDWFATQDGPAINAAFGAYYANIANFSNTYGYDGTQILGGFAGGYDTNLINASSRAAWGVDKDSTFEFMGNTTFGTFDAMSGAKSQWVYNMPEDDDFDINLRYKGTTDGGTNYSFNYSNAYDKNPIVNLSWRSSEGSALLTTRTHVTAGGNTYTTLKLTDSSDATSARYGAYGDSRGISAGIPILQFEQTLARTNNIGGSFDTTFDTETLGPVVIRGEAMYQNGVYSPVMDLAALSIGDLPEALTMVKGDKFKYVLGADITAMTNMMVSLQFIQDINLDYINEDGVIAGNSSITGYKKYTADYATMNLTNQFNKAEETKEFYSLYLSKPYGESGQHRWNNIFMFEENGGKWNRLDTEYTIDDNTQITAEWNKYWGNENTQFGQLEKASNVQLGMKYTF